MVDLAEGVALELAERAYCGIPYASSSSMVGVTTFSPLEESVHIVDEVKYLFHGFSVRPLVTHVMKKGFVASILCLA